MDLPRGVGGAPATYTSEVSVVHLEVGKKVAADESFELPPLADLVAGAAEGHDAAVDPSSAGAAFLYGRLHALEEARATQSQQHVDDAWKTAGRTSLHRWVR